MGKAETKKPVGRPKTELDENSIIDLLGIGCTNEEVATYLNTSVDTLERRFAESLRKGRVKLKESLRRMQIKSANGFVAPDGKYIAPNVTMQIWLGKQFLNQREDPIVVDNDFVSIDFEIDDNQATD